MLAQLAKTFDPLFLCAPITVTAKIFLQKMWSLKLNWDEELPADIKDTWIDLVKAFSGLCDRSFSRHAIDSKNPLKLYTFYNASPQVNGFVIYGVQKGKSYIILSKVKVALIKTKSLSMMELLAVHTEFKALRIL